MLKAIVLLTGVAIYFAFLQIGQETATSALFDVQKLYTQSQAQAAAIAAANR
jgi:hypothetical protein